MDSQSYQRQKLNCRNCEIERLEGQLKELWFTVTSPFTSGDLLEELSHRAPLTLLERIAEHANAQPATLERLSYHPSHEIRVAVAENVGTPHHVIFALTHDSSADVRYSIAENYNSPLEALDLLTEDENPYVAYRAQMTLMRIAPAQASLRFEFSGAAEERKRNQAI
ncbi:unnamed protein product [Sphagnum jensenii]|uniref:HEAT repeat domain-containing protein n=1 Tax=Sphagnum jensenii TaxID=128206 RepID=A0ABP0VD12_9BRYO